MEPEKMRILLAMSDPLEARRLTGMLGKCEQVSVCAQASEVLDALRRRPYDLLIAAFAIRGTDAVQLRERICGEKENSFPVMLVLLPEGLALYQKTLYNGGVAEILRTPVEADALHSCIARLGAQDRLLPDWATDAQVCGVLDRLSIKRSLKGYGCMVKAVQLLIRDGRLLQQLSTSVYPHCAERAGKNGELVERSIRHAIESAWLRGDLEAQYRLFGNTIDEAKGKPTNAEFLSRVVETLRMEA